MRTALALAVLCIASPVLAQAPAANGPAQLRVTVLDQTSAGIPAAVVTVTVAGAAPVKVVADEHGVAIIPGLAAAAAQIHVEAAGFLAHDAQATLRRGTNTQTVTLAIEGFQEQVQVDDTAAAVQESGGAATTNVLDESVVEQLPDDPDELQAVLEQMAGGVGATFRVNGFTGGRLPNREDIRQIRFRTNSFAADNHDAGRVQIEIITRPNVTAWSGNLNANLRNDIFNARDAFAATKTPQNIARIGGGIRGPLAVRKTSLRLNLDRNESNTAANIYALKPDGSPFLGFVSNPSHNTFGVIGLEHALTEMQTLRIEYQRQQNVSRNGGVGGFNLPERANNRENGNGQLRTQVQGLFGRSTLNEFHVEWRDTWNTQVSISDAPSINVLDAFNAGGSGINTRSNQRTFDIADNLDFTIGRKHATRVGVELFGGRYRYFDARNASGTFTFSSLDAYRAGTPLQFTQRLGEVNTSFTAYQAAVYWQDDIRTTRTLTISVGVRQEMQSLIADKLNVMPRVGLTYSPRSSRTIVRGGYGLFYDWYDSNLYDQTLRVNGIAQRDVRVNCPGYPDALAASADPLCQASLGGVPIVQPGGRIQAGPGLRMPQVHQASASIEHPIVANLRAMVTYQMLRGRHQMRSRDINTPDPVTGLRPEPTIGSVTQFESTGKSERDSLNVNLAYAVPRRQMNVAMNYTLAQFKNHADNAMQLPVDSYNPDAEWGPSSQDIRHRLQANVFLPPVRGFRLAVNGLVYQSGAPYNITTGRDDNHDLVINDRPLDAFGNVIGRNSARGAARWGDLSMRLGRAFPFGRRSTDGAAPQARNVEFFAQAENVLNRVNFTNYAGTMTSTLFGRPTAASQARRVQVGMQLRF
ncbi:MAG TPA: TonB-dependent receptor [Vicinamibacterales bacterium]|nr:TonB-dependent receptor [Vicinamibacterales bacterium]